MSGMSPVKGNLLSALPRIRCLPVYGTSLRFEDCHEEILAQALDTDEVSLKG